MGKKSEWAMSDRFGRARERVQKDRNGAIHTYYIYRERERERVGKRDKENETKRESERQIDLISRSHLSR